MQYPRINQNVCNRILDPLFIVLYMDSTRLVSRLHPCEHETQMWFTDTVTNRVADVCLCPIGAFVWVAP